MTKRSPEHPTHPTGAQGAHRRAPRSERPVAQYVNSPPEGYEPYLDGLFTYCLSVLCDHDAATAALGEALALAERRRTPAPADESRRRAWLYALARWVCLRKLAEAKRMRQGAHAAGKGRGNDAAGSTGGHTASDAAGRTRDSVPADATDVDGSAEGADPAAAVLDDERRRQLALLAWPEAAGTTPEQREALELAVRHGLAADEVAAVLGLAPAATRELLAAAACAVERTRAALAVVETGGCPAVARLTGDHQLLLGTALRDELVRHVDDCPRCRRTAERAGSDAWPGTAVAPAALPVVPAPRSAVHAAVSSCARARGGVPRFDRQGFPVDPRDRAARRDRLRARAVTSTVVATVVAAPVLALWAAYRGAPLTGEGEGGRSVTASSDAQGDLAGDRTPDTYENAGNARSEPDSRFTADSRAADVSVEVVSPDVKPSRPGVGPGRLTVEAQPSGGATLITLRASGGAPVEWTAYEGVSWLWLSRTSGTLSPGESATIRVYVDESREPAGPWSARVRIGPGGSVVMIDGSGAGSPSPTVPGRPSPTGPGSPSPSDPSPSPSDTGPSPTDPGPSPSDPGPSPTDPSPTPSPSDPSPSPSDPSPSEPTGPPTSGSPSPSEPGTPTTTGPSSETP
ncbi:BACON domain-containing protein [Streptomyces sp. NPDC002851]